MSNTAIINCTLDRFTQDQVDRFEAKLDRIYNITKSHKVTLVRSFMPYNEEKEFETYIRSHYPSGGFSNNPNVEYYKIADKNGRISPSFKWSFFNIG